MNSAKETIRKELAGPASGAPLGRAAERLRGLIAYRQAPVIYVEPGEALGQIRINSIIDGKKLVMPGPGLKEGFYLLSPGSIPFKFLPQAVTFRGLTRYGTKLSLANLDGLGIGLLVTGAVAVAQNGTRLGRGQGFFDLAAAILKDSKALTEDARTVALIHEEQLLDQQLPTDPWDVAINYALTPTAIHELHSRGITGRVRWELFSQDQTRKLTPLWQLKQKK